jgi:hypothetical protein
MSEHLSDLVLDELALGGRPVPAHVGACARCGTRLSRLREARNTARASGEFSRRRERVLARVDAPGPARSWFHWLRFAAPVAVAAGLAAVVLLREPSDGVRVKGGPFVSLVRQRDGAVDAPLHPGDVVTLSVHAAPHRYALVVVTDATGAVAPLWPARGEQSGDPAVLPATPTFVVTPGSFTLDAYFSDAPLTLAQVRTGVAVAASACIARQQPPDCQPPSPVAGAARHHRLSVPVSSDP